MYTLEKLEEYFKTHPKHFQSDKTQYKQWMGMMDIPELEGYKKDAIDNPDWEVLVDGHPEEYDYFGAINREEKKLILIDYSNICIWLDIHETDETFNENIKCLDEIKTEIEEAAN